MSEEVRECVHEEKLRCDNPFRASPAARHLLVSLRYDSGPFNNPRLSARLSQRLPSELDEYSLSPHFHSGEPVPQPFTPDKLRFRKRRRRSFVGEFLPVEGSDSAKSDKRSNFS